MPRTAKKPTKSKLVKRLDVVFSQWVRLSNRDQRGFCTCVTCGNKFHWKEIQAGHFMSRKHYSTRWDENNVKPQCRACNIFRQGEQYKYSIYLGKEMSDSLLEKSRQIHKFTIGDIQKLLDYYTLKLKKLLS